MKNKENETDRQRKKDEGTLKEGLSLHLFVGPGITSFIFQPATYAVHTALISRFSTSGWRKYTEIQLLHGLPVRPCLCLRVDRKGKGAEC